MCHKPEPATAMEGVGRHCHGSGGRRPCLASRNMDPPAEDPDTKQRPPKPRAATRSSEAEPPRPPVPRDPAAAAMGLAKPATPWPLPSVHQEAARCLPQLPGANPLGPVLAKQIRPPRVRIRWRGEKEGVRRKGGCDRSLFSGCHGPPPPHAGGRQRRPGGDGEGWP